MNQDEIYTKQAKWYESSTGNSDLAMTVKGAAIAFIPLIISILKARGVEITEGQVTEFIEQVFTLVSVSLVLFGMARKVYYFFRK